MYVSHVSRHRMKPNHMTNQGGILKPKKPISLNYHEYVDHVNGRSNEIHSQEQLGRKVTKIKRAYEKYWLQWHHTKSRISCTVIEQYYLYIYIYQ